jgi:hypothetical protein
MNSLSELNSFSATALTVTDSRGSKVIFDRVPPLQPLNQTSAINSTVVSVNPGINIAEIINYATANVRYRVTITTGGTPLLTGSNVTWSSIPAALTLTTASNVYTISGIQTLTHWDAIKSFTWNLPSNYASAQLWYLDVAILYYDSALAQEMVVDWEVYDPRYYSLGNLASAFSVSCIGDDARLMAAAMSSSSSVSASAKRLRGGVAAISGAASLSCLGNRNVDNLEARITLSCAPVKKAVFAIAASSISSVSATLNALVLNMLNRTYLGSQSNLIFASDTPSIDDANPATTSEFSLTLSCSDGKFTTAEYTSPTSPFTYTGTLTQVNAIISSIQFYPNSGSPSNTNANLTFTFAVSKDSTSIYSQSRTLSGTAQAFSSVLYNFGSSTNWKPTNAEVLYGTAAIAMVGGGGGGNLGGGGGGRVTTAATIALTQQEYSITIGSGGSASTASTGSASSGGTTSAFGYSALGGSGGSYLYSSGTANGGASGSNSGGTGYVFSWLTSTGSVGGDARVGGGGGGTSAVGSNAAKSYTWSGGTSARINTRSYTESGTTYSFTGNVSSGTSPDYGASGGAGQTHYSQILGAGGSGGSWYSQVTTGFPNYSGTMYRRKSGSAGSGYGAGGGGGHAAPGAGPYINIIDSGGSDGLPTAGVSGVVLVFIS